MPSASRPRTRSAGTPSFEKSDIVWEMVFRTVNRLREQRIPHSACACWVDEKRIANVKGRDSNRVQILGGQRPCTSQPRSSEERAKAWVWDGNRTKPQRGATTSRMLRSLFRPVGARFIFSCTQGGARSSLALGWLVAGPSARNPRTHFESCPAVVAAELRVGNARTEP